jgi:hypothetical protein
VSGPDYAETDRQSETLAVAIGYPRQPDADGFARAALDTTLGRTPEFSVLEATDLPHTRPDEPMARLVWRIHVDRYEPGLGSREAFDVCYRVEFDYYGATQEPVRIDCPSDAVPVTPAPTARRDIPPEVNPALEAVLTALPAAPTEADVRAAVTEGLPAPPVDEDTGLARVPPEVLVEVKGVDVGVALFARTGVESTDCVLGHRVGGVVAVWSLNWRDLGPHEANCAAETAFAEPR